jgi:mono/diheme cytochrome c family protein
MANARSAGKRRAMRSKKMNTHGNQIIRASLTLTGTLAFCFALTATASPDAGAALYKTKCAACHGADGKGATAVGKADSIRDLGSADVQGQSDAVLNTIITSGKGKMPAYGKSLKPEQVTALVAYIRSLASK